MDVEIARMLSLSQPGISKQKRRILALLGFWIGRLEENKIIREFGDKMSGSLHTYR